MASMRYHFQALLKRVNPSGDRLRVAAQLPGDLRDWLQDHEFVTSYPHSRLSGSYSRDTAILNIKDVDVLLFLPKEHLARTPNAVLLEVKHLLDDYPGAHVNSSSPWCKSPCAGA
jgi:tRNA nucleotidyltransferase (CCA-adding enzyme)